MFEKSSFHTATRSLIDFYELTYIQSFNDC